MVEEQVLTPAERMLRSQARAKIRAPIAGNAVGEKLQQALDRLDDIEAQLNSEAELSDGDDDSATDDTTAVLAELQEQLNDLAGQLEEIRGMLPSADAYEALGDRIAALEAQPQPESTDLGPLVERIEMLETLPDSMGALEERVMGQDKKLAEMAKPKRRRKPRATAAAPAN